MTQTAFSSTAPGSPPGEDMAWVPGGSFLMGSEDFYPEERPVRTAAVEGFWIDTKTVTAAQFRRFVRETGYVTVAERPLDPADCPDADPGPHGRARQWTLPRVISASSASSGRRRVV